MQEDNKFNLEFVLGGQLKYFTAALLFLLLAGCDGRNIDQDKRNQMFGIIETDNDDDQGGQDSGPQPGYYLSGFSIKSPDTTSLVNQWLYGSGVGKEYPRRSILVPREDGSIFDISLGEEIGFWKCVDETLAGICSQYEMTFSFKNSDGDTKHVKKTVFLTETLSFARLSDGVILGHGMTLRFVREDGATFSVSKAGPKLFNWGLGGISIHSDGISYLVSPPLLEGHVVVSFLWEDDRDEDGNFLFSGSYYNSTTGKVRTEVYALVPVQVKE